MSNIQHDCLPSIEWGEFQPEDIGMDSKTLHNADRQINAQFKKINSLVVIRKGRVALENYYNGFGPEDCHRLMSITKSFVSALIGIAVDKKLIKGLDQTLGDFFPEHFTGDTHRPMEDITLRQLLTMTSGIYCSYAKTGREPIFEGMFKRSNWLKSILQMPVEEEMSGKFQYNSLNSHLLSAIITKVSGINALEFARENLFGPLGIKASWMDAPSPQPQKLTFVKMIVDSDKYWAQDPQGNNVGGCGLPLSPRHLAGLGYLYLNKGSWAGKQILSSQWIEESTKPQTSDGGYGFHWWVGSENGYYTYAAKGWGGQFIFVVPQLDLVTVIVTDTTPGKPKEPDPKSIFNEYVIPAVIQE